MNYMAVVLGRTENSSPILLFVTILWVNCRPDGETVYNLITMVFTFMICHFPLLTCIFVHRGSRVLNLEFI